MWRNGFCCNGFVGIRFSDSFFDVINHPLLGGMDVWHDNLSALVVTVLVTAALVWCISFIGVGWGLYIRTSSPP